MHPHLFIITRSALTWLTIPTPLVGVLDVGGDFIIVTLDEVPTGVRIIICAVKKRCE